MHVNRHVISRRNAALQPNSNGSRPDVGGAKAAIHATRRYIKQLTDNHVLIRLDFNNAFNSVYRSGEILF